MENAYSAEFFSVQPTIFPPFPVVLLLFLGIMIASLMDVCSFPVLTKNIRKTGMWKRNRIGQCAKEMILVLCMCPLDINFRDYFYSPVIHSVIYYVLNC